MTNKQKCIYFVKAAILAVLAFMAVSADITAEMKFTEDTRQGLYVKASEKGLP